MPRPGGCFRGTCGVGVGLYLGGDVVGGAAEGGGPVLSKHVLLAHAKVCDLDVSVLVQHHIV